MSGGVSVPLDDSGEPVTAYEAAKALGRAPSTIHLWAMRYDARRYDKKVDRKRYYDMCDLRVIEREIHHGHPVPATWQERAAIRHRCPLKAQTPAAA